MVDTYASKHFPLHLHPHPLIAHLAIVIATTNHQVSAYHHDPHEASYHVVHLCAIARYDTTAATPVPCALPQGRHIYFSNHSSIHDNLHAFHFIKLHVRLSITSLVRHYHHHYISETALATSSRMELVRLPSTPSVARWATYSAAIVPTLGT